MAVVWAKSAGNWSTASLWAFWNESTQQIENYGQTPQVGDIVYCNGYIIQTNGLNIQLTIRNDENPYTGIQGGHIGPQTNWAQNATFTIKAFFCGNENLISKNSSNTYFYNGLRFNCDVYILGAGTFCFKTGSNLGFSWTLNGNVFASGSGSLFNDDSYNASTITINGNVTSSAPANGFITRTGTTYLRINGNVVWNGILGANSVLINGNYSVTNASTSTTSLSVTGDINVVNGNIIATTLNFGGQNIQYANTANSPGLLARTINFINDNANTFTWKDVTEPRSNPFIIVTNAEMNNRQQYPSENEVKQGVEYIWGEKVGTYQAPPESVVLKDYEYDTITAEENDIATYNLTRYIYADYGTLHWFELKTTTTDIVTDPTSQSIDIDGDTVVADTDYVVEYNDVCYQWSGSAWGSITTKNIGTVKTDIVTNPTEATLCAKKGSLETTNISQQLISRLENCATIETVQQLLVAHLDN